MNLSIFITTLIFIASSPSSAIQAETIDKCDSYRDKINRLQALNSRGGTAKQQALRRKKIDNYEGALRKCGNRQTIEVAYGQQTTERMHYKKTPNSARHSPQLQQLIATCNYWVEQTRKHPSWDNSNFRDSACRDADNAKRSMHNVTPKNTPNTRKLSECIKPNNVIDEQVNECTRGTRTRDW